MNKHPYIEAPTLTKNEFKAQVIASINSAEFTPELLRKMLPIMPDDKRTLFEKYRATDIVDPISNDKDEWERGAYFHKQLKMAEQNFCLERIEHLIAVKSYLIERGIAGFSSPKKTAPNTLSTSQKDKTMSTTFLSIDSTDFKPSSSLRNCVDGDDMSSIRNSLFMEMNDKRMTNETLLQAIAWTLKKHSNLFVTYEENAYAQAMEMDDGKWDRQYYSLQEVYTSMNFSEERVLHMLEVRNHVFNIQPNMTSIQPKTAVSVGTSVPQTTQKTPPPHTRINKAPDNKNEINTLLLIGGALAALALVFLAVII